MINESFTSMLHISLKDGVISLINMRGSYDQDTLKQAPEK